MDRRMSRREVIQLAGILPFMTFFPRTVSSAETLRNSEKPIRLGIIGFGIRGEQLVRATGFASPQWEAKMKDSAAYRDFVEAGKLNVVYTGVCDIYDPRAENALATVGKTAKRFHRYQDMMESKEIDAVIIATPDHLHAPMIIAAAKAGKHVYVEKCMTHNLAETREVYNAVKKSGITFQLGHQLRQKDTYVQARDLLVMDILGEVTVVETSTNRNSPNAAWVYDIPEDASEKNIDWKQFDTKRQFDADRFFRWRKYWDYGTGLAGDLLTHEFDSLNFVMKLGIPHSATASGGIYHYRDGREVPDVFHVTFEYPDKGLTFLYSATLANDHHRPTLIMGNDATMRLDNKIEVIPNSGSTKYREKFDQGIMHPGVPFYEYPSKEHPAVTVDIISSPTSRYFAAKGMMSTFKDGKTVDPTRLHLFEWLMCIENGWTPSCNIEAGLAEAVAAHMATMAYRLGKTVFWDNQKMEIVY